MATRYVYVRDLSNLHISRFASLAAAARAVGVMPSGIWRALQTRNARYSLPKGAVLRGRYQVGENEKELANRPVEISAEQLTYVIDLGGYREFFSSSEELQKALRERYAFRHDAARIVSLMMTTSAPVRLILPNGYRIAVSATCPSIHTTLGFTIIGSKRTHVAQVHVTSQTGITGRFPIPDVLWAIHAQCMMKNCLHTFFDLTVPLIDARKGSRAQFIVFDSLITLPDIPIVGPPTVLPSDVVWYNDGNRRVVVSPSRAKRMNIQRSEERVLMGKRGSSVRVGLVEDGEVVHIYTNLLEASRAAGVSYSCFCKRMRATLELDPPRIEIGKKGMTFERLTVHPRDRNTK